MPEDRGTRYETLIASLIGLLALAVSAYTAFIQRQQVRAQVWPILEFDNNNAPQINFTVANKGSGPALVRHVVISIDGKRIPDWNTLVKTLLGPGTYSFSSSTLGGVALSAGEKLEIFTLNMDSKDPRWAKMDKERLRVDMDVCYCSTLGDCWTLRSPSLGEATTDETRRCPAEPAFKQ